MQISIQSPAVLERRIEVTLPQEKVAQAFADQLKGYQRKARIPGFRPGKAPLNVIRKNFGDQIGQDLTSRWIREGYIKAMEEGNFRPVGSPDISDVSAVQEEAPFSFVISCQVFPEVEAPVFEGFSLKKTTFEVQDADVQQVVDRLRWNQAEFADKADGAANGDRVIIDFVGKIDGKAFEGGSAEGMPVVLGMGSLIAGFEEQLIGVKAGESKEIEVQFPENYGNPDLANQKATFEVEIKQVLGRQVLPESDELAGRFELESLENLRSEIRTGLEEEANKAAFQRLKEQVMDQLHEGNSIELPELLVSNQVSALWRDFLAQQNVQLKDGLPEMPEDAKAQFQPAAEKMVALGILVSAIGEKEGIDVADGEVQEELSRRAMQSQNPAAMIAWYQEDEKRLGEIKMMILENKVTQLIVDKAAIEEESSQLGSLLPSESPENQPKGIEAIRS